MDAQGRVVPVERFTALQERLTLLLPEGLAPGAYAVRVQLSGGLRVGSMVVEQGRQAAHAAPSGS